MISQKEKRRTSKDVFGRTDESGSIACLRCSLRAVSASDRLESRATLPEECEFNCVNAVMLFRPTRNLRCFSGLSDIFGPTADAEEAALRGGAACKGMSARE